LICRQGVSDWVFDAEQQVEPDNRVCHGLCAAHIPRQPHLQVKPTLGRQSIRAKVLWSQAHDLNYLDTRLGLNLGQVSEKNSKQRMVWWVPENSNKRKFSCSIDRGELVFEGLCMLYSSPITRYIEKV